MVEFTTISELLIAFSVIFGIITWYLQNRDNKMINQARLFMQIYGRFNEEDFYSKYNEIVSREAWKEYEKERTTIGLIAAFYEGIGILVEQKLIDIELVSRLMSTNILLFWEKVEPTIQEFRKRTDNPHAWEYAEWLHNNIKSSRLERKPMYI